MICVSETSPEHQRSSEMHSKKTVLIKTIETRDGEVEQKTITFLSLSSTRLIPVYAASCHLQYKISLMKKNSIVKKS